MLDNKGGSPPVLNNKGGSRPTIKLAAQEQPPTEPPAEENRLLCDGDDGMGCLFACLLVSRTPKAVVASPTKDGTYATPWEVSHLNPLGQATLFTHRIPTPPFW